MMKKTLSRIGQFMAAAVAGLLVPFTASAKVDDLSGALTNLSTTLESNVNQIITIVQYIIGIVVLVMLITGAVKYFKNDPSSGETFMKIGGGLVILIVLFQLIKAWFLT